MVLLHIDSISFSYESGQRKSKLFPISHFWWYCTASLHKSWSSGYFPSACEKGNAISTLKPRTLNFKLTWRYAPSTPMLEADVTIDNSYNQRFFFFVWRNFKHEHIHLFCCRSWCFCHRCVLCLHPSFQRHLRRHCLCLHGMQATLAKSPNVDDNVAPPQPGCGCYCLHWLRCIQAEQASFLFQD